MFYYVVNSFITRQPPRRSLLLRKSVKYFGAKLSPPRRTLQQKCLPWGKKLRVQPPPAREQTLLTFGNMRIARKMKRFFIPPDLIFLVAIWEKLFNNVKEETEKCPTISSRKLCLHMSHGNFNYIRAISAHHASSLSIAMEKIPEYFPCKVLRARFTYNDKYFPADKSAGILIDLIHA